MAVIKVESNFVPEAHSGVAGGLMQLTEETAEWNAKELGITTEYDYMDPETNIRFGCHYLRHLIDVYGNIDTALAAYNGGMGNVYLNIFYHSLFFLRRMKMKIKNIFSKTTLRGWHCYSSVAPFILYK